MMRKCSECGLEKYPENFPADKRRPDGRGSICRTCMAARTAAWRKAHPDATARHNAAHARRMNEDPEYRKLTSTRNKGYRDKIKVRVIQHYGGKCACCGEAEPVFLSIEHVEGNGTAHRKQIGGGGYMTYLWLQREGFPGGYEVLCHNCNQGKQINGGICPHQARR